MRKSSVKLIFAFFAAAALLVTASCNRGKSSANEDEMAEGTHAVTVIEVIQTSNYTYLQVLEDEGQYWIAINAREIKPGDVLYFSEALEMKDFISRELSRTFPVIYFVQDASDTPIKKQEPVSMGKPELPKMKGIEIDYVEGSETIAGIFANKGSLNGETVKIRGVVVKLNKNIMGKNWVHIQDGTGEEGNFDLTITTGELPAVGSIATFEGKIAIDKDFGAGYKYDIIMEDATVSDVKTDAQVF